MTLSLQEISDRIEIAELLVAYCDAIDTQDWAAMDEVFTADVVADYTAFGPHRGDRTATKEYLARVMSRFRTYQHMVATSKVTLQGDRATVRSICHNPVVREGADGREQVTLIGLWYRDRVVRTPRGWRISERVLEHCYTLGSPSGSFVPSGADR